MTDVAIHYVIDFSHPKTHTLKVACTVSNLKTQTLEFSLPTWTPGSYLIRDFAQHISHVTASTGSIVKKDKTTWVCTLREPTVTLSYDVYAFDPSVRAAFFDDTHAFINGASVFMRFHGFETVTHDVTLARGALKGAAYTSMASAQVDAHGFGRYRAENYDELIDHPILVGEVACESFQVDGINHRIVVFPAIDFDSKRLAQDCQKICAEHIDLFGSPAPFSDYTFLLRAEENAYGGLEHRASSALVCKVSDLPLKHQPLLTEGYRGLLGLFSHEYFHAWNIKRLRPEPFLNFDYRAENYTDLLWFFEGFTSYYDDLALVRSGAIDEKNYFELLSKAVSRVYAEQGRLKQTLADSSFDSWIKFYKPNENSANANVSYYLKGSLVGLVLDLSIRRATADKKSLDDVMRVLWRRHSTTGITEASIRACAVEVVGQNFDDFFDTYVHGCTDLPLEQCFAYSGIEVLWKSPFTQDAASYLGCSLKADDTGTVATVSADSPAEKAGLCPGDTVVAINGWRVRPAKLEAELVRFAPGHHVTLHVFRRGWLKELLVTLGDTPKTKCVLRVADKTSQSQEGARKAWLHR